MCHNNIIKQCHERGNIDPILLVHGPAIAFESEEDRYKFITERGHHVKLDNYEVLANIDGKLIYPIVKERCYILKN